MPAEMGGLSDAFFEWVKERAYPRRPMRKRLRRLLPRFLYEPLRVLLTPWNLVGAWRFVTQKGVPLARRERIALVRRLYKISSRVECPHDESQMLAFLTALLALPDTVEGCIVEAGCYKGGSGAKISLAARITGRDLVLCDSFAGLPDPQEQYDRSIFGRRVAFAQGDWSGTLEEVRRHIAQWGHPECCRYVEGWFEETLPHFDEPIAALYLDVDLASSTRTCLKYLYPRLSPGGVLFSHDGHLPPIVEVYNDARFWQEEVGCPRPVIHGLGERALIHMVKEAPSPGVPS